MARPFVVLDTETTGLDKGSGRGIGRYAEVCQIGGLVLDEQQNVERAFCYYTNTVTAECDQSAAKVNGISMREYRRLGVYDFLPDILCDNLPELFKDDTVVIGYNIGFDLQMIDQTIHSALPPLKYSILRSPMLPRKGRHAVDLVPYFAVRGKRQKLSSLTRFYKEGSDKLVESITSGGTRVHTNSRKLFTRDWAKAHNSLYDAINTYILWRDKIWKTELL